MDLPNNKRLQKMSEAERLSIFRKMPKMELHLHGDIGCPVNKLIDAYHMYVKPEEDVYSDLEIISSILCNYKVSNLVEFIEKCRMIGAVMAIDSRILEIMSEETVMQKYREGVVGLEMRISPSYIYQICKYEFDDVINRFHLGINRAKERTKDKLMEIGLIHIGEIGINDIFPFEKSIDLFLENKDKFIGFDNAGYPASYEPFYDQYQRLKDADVNITLHAGESPNDPPNYIQQAIHCGAKRIGHGIECIKDPRLVQELIDRDILLEICPKSNYITAAHIKYMKDHPVRKIYEAGVKICINTDDPMMMANTLIEEYDTLFKHFGFGCDDFMKMNTWALEKSFLPMDAKIRLKETYFPNAQF